MKHLSRTQDDMEWVGMVWYDGLVRDGMGWDPTLWRESGLGTWNTRGNQLFFISYASSADLEEARN